MKQMKQLFRALLGVVILVCAIPVAVGRLAWRVISRWLKRCSKWVCRMIVATMLLFAVGFISMVCYFMYQDNHGRSYYNHRHLSKNIKVHHFNDHTFRVYNICDGEYTTPKLSWVTNAPQNDSLSIYALHGKRGYISVNTGEIVIDAESNNYRKAWFFSEGLAAVMKEGKIGFINNRNEVVIPFQYYYCNKEREYGFGYRFHNGYCVMTDKEGKLGLIDTTGKWIVNAVYDNISDPKWRGCRVVVKDDKYGVLDSCCNEIYPVEYNSIEVLSDGFVLADEGKKWQVDVSGNVVQPFMYDNFDWLCYPIEYEAYSDDDVTKSLSDYAKYEIMNRYGIMNRITGKPITPAIYLNINMLSIELFEVQNPESNDWYVIDSKGNAVNKQ